MPRATQDGTRCLPVLGLRRRFGFSRERFVSISNKLIRNRGRSGFPIMGSKQKVLPCRWGSNRRSTLPSKNLRVAGEPAGADRFAQRHPDSGTAHRARRDSSTPSTIRNLPKISVRIIRTLDSQGRSLNIEMQVRVVAGLIKRPVYNGCSLYVEQLRAGAA